MLIAFPESLGLYLSVLLPLDTLARFDALLVVASVTFAGVTINYSGETMPDSVSYLTLKDRPNEVLALIVEIELVLLVLVPIKIL